MGLLSTLSFLTTFSSLYHCQIGSIQYFLLHSSYFGRIIDECYEKAKKILRDNMEILHACAALLLEKEKVYQEEFEALFAKKEIVSDGGKE